MMALVAKYSLRNNSGESIIDGEHTADTSRADGLVMPYSTLDEKEHSNTPTTQDILRL